MASYYVRATGGSDANGGTSHADGWATIQKALDTMTTGQANRCNLSGSFTLSSSLSTATYGTATPDNFLLFNGYTTTEGDGGICTIDGGTNAIIDANTIDAYNFRGLLFKNWGSAFALNLDGEIVITGCEFDGEDARIGAVDANVGLYFAGNKVHSIAASGSVVTSSTHSRFLNNYVHCSSGSNFAVGLNLNQQCVALNNVISLDTTTTQRGIQSASADNVIIGNSVFNQLDGTGFGLNLSSSAINHQIVLNNILCGFNGAGGMGINHVSGSQVAIYGHNKFWNNTTHEGGTKAVSVDYGNNDTLGANPFKSTGNADHNDDDFEISAAEAAWPTELYDPGGAFGTRNQDFADVGALTREYAGGGDTIIIARPRRVM